MSAPSPPPDRSVELRQLELDAAEKDRQRQAAADEAKRQAALAARSAAVTGARSQAENYFNQQGVAPDAYEGDIQSYINSVLGGISPDDPNPGAYFTGVGEQAYTSAQSGERNRAMRELDREFAPNFEYTRIPDTMDDPVLAAIEAEQRQTADQYVNNLLSRGVITAPGATAAESALDKQKNAVMAMLNELGMGALETGRESLRGVTNRARSTASQKPLGTPFDPYSYGTEVDQKFSDWLTNLGGALRGKVTKNLYDTSGLPTIAGAAQGAGNTAYNPKAVAGLLNPEDDNTDPNRLNATSVF